MRQFRNLKVTERSNLSVEKSRKFRFGESNTKPNCRRSKRHSSEKESQEIHCDNEAFGMIVPVPVGLKLAELGTGRPV